MDWVFLSPHYDDAVFSCGGLIWELAQSGRRTAVHTVCGGQIPDGPLSSLAEELHRSWGLSGDVVSTRREEDRQACRILGAEPIQGEIPDAVYRQHPDGTPCYPTEEHLFGGLDPGEKELVDRVTRSLQSGIPGDSRIAAPLGIGSHVDHQLVRKAANRLEREVVYYGDYPYIRESDGAEIVAHLERSPDWESEVFRLSPNALERWQEAGTAYASQIDTFWADQSVFREEIAQLARSMGGVRLWMPLEEG